MVKKWGRERLYLSCNYSWTIFSLVKSLLVKLKNFYIQHAWILIMKKQNSNQKCEGWKESGVCQKCWPLSSLEKDLKLKFRSKFNYSFTNHGYLHSAILKALYNFMEKEPTRQEATNFSFKLFKMMWFLRSPKFWKATVTLTFTTQKANVCSPWTACSYSTWKTFNILYILFSFTSTHLVSIMQDTRSVSEWPEARSD